MAQQQNMEDVYIIYRIGKPAKSADLGHLNSGETILFEFYFNLFPILASEPATGTPMLELIWSIVFCT